MLLQHGTTVNLNMCFQIVSHSCLALKQIMLQVIKKKKKGALAPAPDCQHQLRRLREPQLVRQDAAGERPLRPPGGYGHPGRRFGEHVQSGVRVPALTEQSVKRGDLDDVRSPRFLFACAKKEQGVFEEGRSGPRLAGRGVFPWAAPCAA